MFSDIVHKNIETTPIDFYNSCIYNRINNHKNFILDRNADPNKDNIKHFNKNLEMQVMTNQEADIKLAYINEIKREDDKIVANYVDVEPNKASISVPIIKKSKAELTLF